MITSGPRIIRSVVIVIQTVGRVDITHMHTSELIFFLFPFMHTPYGPDSMAKVALSGLDSTTVRLFTVTLSFSQKWAKLTTLPRTYSQPI